MLMIHIIALCLSLCASNIHAATSDLLIFSKDRPLQLQAFLESMNFYITGLQKVAVLCHAQNDRFLAAYHKLSLRFPHVEFIYQDRYHPRQDFWRLTESIFNTMTAPYCMFGTDDTLVIDYIDITQCTKVMKDCDAYAFYPYMGRDIIRCYMTNTKQYPPKLDNIGSEFITWDLRAGAGPWGYIHSVYMAIYKRQDIQHLFSVIHPTSPNTFEEMWGGGARTYHKMHGVGYNISRIINIPLNLVQNDCPYNKHSGQYTVEQLLEYFEQGVRINFKSFYQFKHDAPHMNATITFIKP